MATLYCLDTSTLIESWWRLYPPVSFPSFWERLDEGISSQCFVAPEIVKMELSRQDDELYKWVNQRPLLFVPLDVELQLKQAMIVNTFPKLTTQQTNRSLADPWVIALAQLRGCPVVSMERPGSDSRPRIPDVCRRLDIVHMEIVDLIRTMGWRF